MLNRYLLSVLSFLLHSPSATPLQCCHWWLVLLTIAVSGVDSSVTICWPPVFYCCLICRRLLHDGPHKHYCTLYRYAYNGNRVKSEFADATSIETHKQKHSYKYKGDYFLYCSALVLKVEFSCTLARKCTVFNVPLVLLQFTKKSIFVIGGRSLGLFRLQESEPQSKNFKYQVFEWSW